jgi:RHS repeat-associated protein
VTKKDPLGRTTTYGYDALDRLTAIAYASTTTPNVAYVYDASGNRTRMTDGTGTTNYTYDERSRLLSVTASANQKVSYAYDQENLIRLAYPDGKAITYTYDAANELTKITDWSARITQYTYELDGQLGSISHNNGSSTTYDYDDAGRLIQVWNKYGSGTITRDTYTLDTKGQRVHDEEVPADGSYTPVPITPKRTGTVDNVYDGMGRLVREDRRLPNPQGNTLIEHTYDAVGNRIGLKTTTLTCCPDTTTYTYDKADRITAALGDNDERFTVDANGNLVKRGTFGDEVLTYDQENRLLGVGRIKYVYDGDGKRTRKQDPTFVSSTRHDYVYDVNSSLPRLLTEITSHGTTKYVWGPGGLAYVVQPNDDEAVYHLDGLGSMVAMSQDNVAPDFRFTEYEVYTGYGERGYSNRSFDQSFYFAGEQLDEESDYYYLRNRYYDPKLGRFLTRDSYAGNSLVPSSLNRYSYAMDNPSNITDPSGLLGQGSCLQGAAQLPVYFSAAGCVVTMSNGQFGLTLTLGAGGSTTVAISGGIALQVSPKANTLNDLAGDDVSAGGSIGAGKFISGGLDVSRGGNSTGNLSVGLSIPIPAEIHAEKTHTWVVDPLAWVGSLWTNFTAPHTSHPAKSW